MSFYLMSNVEKKAIIAFDKIAKDSFPIYYVNSLCEAFAPLSVYEKRNCYSFVKDPECRLAFIFRIFNISNESVISLNHISITNAMTKLSAIEGLETRLSNIYIKLNEIKAKNWEKVEESSFEENGYYFVKIGAVSPIDTNIANIYKLSVNNGIDFKRISEHEVEAILSKQEVVIEDKDYHLIMLKPLLPGINALCELYKTFSPYPDPANDELFIANFLIVKEQFYSYHKFIGIIW